jgi:low affinity Fe/Cu permease
MSATRVTAEHVDRRFSRLASHTARWTGSPWVFLANALFLLVWLLAGAALHWSNHWQLFIGTVTNVITYLMVFAIQNTQNRDSAATHAKLDELLLKLEGPRSELAQLETRSPREIEELRGEAADVVAREEDEHDARS